MKDLKKTTKKELYRITQILEIRKRSKMSKTELYLAITDYMKANYEFSEQHNMFIDQAHVSGYCIKDNTNAMVEIYQNEPFTLTTMEDIIKLDIYDNDLLTPLILWLNGTIFYVCSDDNYDFLVIESDEYYGFLTPNTKDDDDEEEEEEMISLVNTKEEYENHKKVN